MELKDGYVISDVGIIPKNWSVKKLEDIGLFSKGRGIKKDEALSGIIPCVRYGEIYTTHNDYIKKFHSYISGEVAKTSKKINKGDILFAGSGETKEEIGKCVAFINGFEAYAGGDIVILSPNNCDSLFLGFLLNSEPVQKQKSSKGQGDAVVHIHAHHLGKISIPLPPLPEQQAIAEVLSATDNLIQALEKQIAKKRLIKQGVMQQLLTPKEGWEEKKLGDVGEVKMCRRVFNHETETEGTIPFYKIGTFGKEANAFIAKELYDNYRRRFSFPKKGDILISAAGTIGRTLIYDGKPAYFQDSNIVWIDNNEGLISNNFLYYVLKIVKYNTEGGTIQRLYNSILRSAEFSCPSKTEQTHITTILFDMDKEIQELEIKLNKYQQLKQGLMQNLLTGKIRLV